VTLRDEPPPLVRIINARRFDRHFYGPLFIGRFNRPKESCRSSAQSIDAPTVALLI
jgi:hypothetical protein